MSSIYRSKNHRFAALPILVSALFPGVGQFMQRRYLAGVVILMAFGAILAGFMVCVFMILVEFYGIGFNFEHHEPGELPLRPALVLFCLGFVLYLVNLVDAFRGHMRTQRPRLTPPEV